MPPGLVRTPLPTLDETRKLGRLSFDRVPAIPVGAPGRAWPIVERVLDLAAVALAAEQVGGAQRCLDMAVDHAKARVQFGRPIGSFQAVKHKCADVLIAVETARSAAHHAATCAAIHANDLANDELPIAASLAKRIAPPHSSTRLRKTCRSTAASASPGTILHISTSSARSQANCSSAALPATENDSPGSFSPAVDRRTGPPATTTRR
jgi:hypothetical protein